MRKIKIVIIACCILAACFITGCADSDDIGEYVDTAQQGAEEFKEKADALKEKADQIKEGMEEEDSDPEADSGAASDISLTDLDGYSYRLTCRGEEYTAQYSYDNWHIIDSWKIKNNSDILKICGLLLEEHPVHGSDLQSYRTAEDMAFEWQQHNIAYQVLPEDNVWRQHAKDVDLDPQDQGRTFEEIYEDRTGQQLNLEDLLR